MSATDTVFWGRGWCIGRGAGRFSRAIGFCGNGYDCGWGRLTMGAVLFGYNGRFCCTIPCSKSADGGKRTIGLPGSKAMPCVLEIEEPAGDIMPS